MEINVKEGVVLGPGKVLPKIGLWYIVNCPRLLERCVDCIFLLMLLAAQG